MIFATIKTGSISGWLFSDTGKVINRLFGVHIFTSGFIAFLAGLVGFLVWGLLIVTSGKVVTVVGTVISITVGLACYVYLQWKVLNQRLFKSQLKKKLSQEWSQELGEFFWKKIFLLWSACWLGLILLVFGVLSARAWLLQTLNGGDFLSAFSSIEAENSMDSVMDIAFKFLFSGIFLVALFLSNRYLAKQLAMIVQKSTPSGGTSLPPS